MYPTLEDMRVSQLQQAEQEYFDEQVASAVNPQHSQLHYNPDHDFKNSVEYPSLHEDYKQIFGKTSTAPAQSINNADQETIAPISNLSIGLKRAQLDPNVRQVWLHKNAKGKVGMKLKEVNMGIFVQLVIADSPAAVNRIRLGDQIIQLEGQDVLGKSGVQVMNMIGKIKHTQFSVAVRDRPFERTITLRKDSSNHVGFTFRNGQIKAIAKDTSAARNGLLIEHQILEVDGRNVVGLQDKDLGAILAEPVNSVTLTIMPSVLFNQMMQKIGWNLVTKLMDHRIPEIA